VLLMLLIAVVDEEDQTELQSSDSGKSDRLDSAGRSPFPHSTKHSPSTRKVEVLPDCGSIEVFQAWMNMVKHNPYYPRTVFDLHNIREIPLIGIWNPKTGYVPDITPPEAKRLCAANVTTNVESGHTEFMIEWMNYDQRRWRVRLSGIEGLQSPMSWPGN
jgi:hypothetical protein